MAADVIDGALDALLTYVRDSINSVVALTTEPATYADTQDSSKKVAYATLTSSDFSLDVGQAGYRRRLDFMGKDLGNASIAGPITWFAFVDTLGSQLILKIPALASIDISAGAPLTVESMTSLVQMADPLNDLYE